MKALPAFIIYFLYRFWVTPHLDPGILDVGATGTQMYCVVKALHNPLTCVAEANLLGPLLPFSIYGTYYYFLIIPVILFFIFWRQKKYSYLLLYLSAGLACLATFPVNLDTTRVVGFILFPIIIISLWEIVARYPAKIKWLWLLLFLTLISPHLYVINGTLRYFKGFFDFIWEQFLLTIYPALDIIDPLNLAFNRSLAPRLLFALVILIYLINKLLVYLKNKNAL